MPQLGMLKFITLILLTSIKLSANFILCRVISNRLAVIIAVQNANFAPLTANNIPQREIYSILVEVDFPAQADLAMLCWCAYIEVDRQHRHPALLRHTTPSAD